LFPGRQRGCQAGALALACTPRDHAKALAALCCELSKEQTVETAPPLEVSKAALRREFSLVRTESQTSRKLYRVWINPARSAAKAGVHQPAPRASKAPKRSEQDHSPR